MILTALITLITSLTAMAEDCPTFQGAYLYSCPEPGGPYTMEIIRQPNCNNISFQTVKYSKNGTPTFSNPIWYPINAGKLVVAENARYQKLTERFFDRGTLYTYHYILNKELSQISFESADLLVKLNNANLLRTVDQSSQVLINKARCLP